MAKIVTEMVFPTFIMFKVSQHAFKETKYLNTITH